MKHKNTQAVFEYWRRRRLGARVPSRSDIEPSDIHALLGDTFILECDRSDTAPLRLAGSRICALFNNELKGMDFLDFWQGRNRATLNEAITIGREDGSCVLLGWQGNTRRDYKVAGELILLPLSMGGGPVLRIMGTFVPLTLPFWLGSVPLVSLDVRSLRILDPDARPTAIPLRRVVAVTPPPVPPRARPGRSVAHLTVYEGGLRQD